MPEGRNITALISERCDDEVVLVLVKRFQKTAEDFFNETGKRVDRKRVYEMLNALALTATDVIGIAEGQRSEAREFFLAVLGASIDAQHQTLKLPAGYRVS